MKLISHVWLVLISAVISCAPITNAQTAVASGPQSSPVTRHSLLPTFDEAMNSKRDVWGEAAMAEPNGASYEFFAPLLPPPRYVHADFRHYPIVLSAPNATVKARLISNGSGVNLHGGARSWTDNDTPVTFRVGPDEFLFGGLRDRVTDPTLAEGWLPIVEIRYRHPSPVQSEGIVPIAQKRVEVTPEIYRLEAFAGTDEAFASNCVVFVKFDLSQGTNGYVAVDVGAKSELQFADNRIRDNQGRVLAVFDGAWKWERGLAVARLGRGMAATLAIPTKPLEASTPLTLTPATHAEQRVACAHTWRKILA